MLEYEPLLDSSNMTYDDYVHLANDIYVGAVQCTVCALCILSLVDQRCQKNMLTVFTIGVILGGYEGYAYPPLFKVGGTVPPTFKRYKSGYFCLHLVT